MITEEEMIELGIKRVMTFSEATMSPTLVIEHIDGKVVKIPTSMVRYEQDLSGYISELRKQKRDETIDKII